MKNLSILYSFLMFITLQSCGGEDPILQTESWILDSFTSVDTRIINSGENKSIQLNISSIDLCEANGVSILIQVNGRLEYDDHAESFDFDLDLGVPKNADIVILTVINILDPLNTCLELGSVECTLTY